MKFLFKPKKILFKPKKETTSTISENLPKTDDVTSVLKEMSDEKHFRFDMVGKWKATWNGNDCSYHLRLTVETGENGEHIWRGTAADQPFWVNTTDQINTEMIDQMASMPAHSRIHINIDDDYPCQTSLQVIEKRGGGYLVGDELPIGGIIQWKIAEEESNEEFLKSYRYVGVDIERQLALEFVSGCFSPSTRRLVIHGTHKSNVGKYAIGRDIYDLTVAEDFRSISGVSQSNDSFASARVDLSKIDKDDCYTVDGVNFSSIRDRDKEQIKLYDAAAAALEKIKDVDARILVKDAQDSMFASALAGKDLEESFTKMKEVGKKQSDRLTKLMSMCMEKYYHLKERYGFIESIDNMQGQEQMLLPTSLRGENPADQVRVLLSIAQYQEPIFREMMRNLVKSLNKCALDPNTNSFETFCEEYNLDDSKLPLDINSTIGLPNCEKKTVAHCYFGPPKGFERALDKIKDGGSLKDLNRATIIFEDPYVMWIAFQAIQSKHKLVTVKNKFCKDKCYNQPPDLHLIINLDSNGWLVEIQLMFCDILKIKKELHKYYEIMRATSALEMLSPVFKVNLGDNDVTH